MELTGNLLIGTREVAATAGSNAARTVMSQGLRQQFVRESLIAHGSQETLDRTHADGRKAAIQSQHSSLESSAFISRLTDGELSKA